MKNYFKYLRRMMLKYLLGGIVNLPIAAFGAYLQVDRKVGEWVMFPCIGVGLIAMWYTWNNYLPLGPHPLFEKTDEKIRQ